VTIAIVVLAAVAVVYGGMALWFRHGFEKRTPLCGYALSPEILERIEERLKSEGKPVPRWVTEGRKRWMQCSAPPPHL
jgi:hypothetical protein